MENRETAITLFFPVYNDQNTVRRVTEKALDVLSSLTKTYEVLIINDGSPDQSGLIADQLAKEYGHVRVIHHERNLGYGAALRSGFENAKYEWICFTDGDDEYDVYDLHKLIRLKDFYDLVITFRYVKAYSGFRQFISWVYNTVLRFIFKIKYRDVSTGLRLIRKDLIADLNLASNSPFIGAEIAIKSMLKGFRVGEVGIQTFPREFGKGSSTSVKNIIATIKDMLRTYKLIFSRDYDLPANRLNQNNERGGLK